MELLQAIKRVAVFAGILILASSLSSMGVYSPLIVISYVLLVFLGLVYFATGIRRLLDIIVMLAVAMAATALAIYRLPPVSDEESLVLYAAYLFRHGANPYITNLSKAYTMFPVSEPVVTVTLTPQYYVTMLGYPALYFELVSLVFPHPQFITVPVAFLLYLFLRKKGAEEAFFIMALVYEGYFPFFFTGGSLAVLVFALTVVAISLDDVYMSFLLGLAGAIMQYPLLYLPFIWKDNLRNPRRLALTTALPILAFLIPNAPFISLRWAEDALGPLLQPIANEGLSISLLNSIGFAVPHYAYAIAMVVMYIGLLIAYRPNTRWKWLMPAFLWLVSWRDLNYFSFYLAIWVVSLWLRKDEQPKVTGL
jgi:hypothetical protein